MLEAFNIRSSADGTIDQHCIGCRPAQGAQLLDGHMLGFALEMVKMACACLAVEPAHDVGGIQVAGGPHHQLFINAATETANASNASTLATTGAVD